MAKLPKHKNAFILIRSSYRRTFKHPHWGDFKDPRSIRPEKAALTLASDDGNEETVNIDLTTEAGVTRLQGIIDNAGNIITHEMNDFLFAMWSMNVRVETDKIFSTWVTASCLLQGNQKRIHGHTVGDFEDDPAETIRKQEDANKEWTESMELGKLVEANIQDRGEGSKTPPHPQKNKSQFHNGGRFRFNAIPSPFAELAGEVALLKEVYHQLLPKVENRGMVKYLHEIEFPFGVATAWTQWLGLKVSRKMLDGIRERCHRTISRTKGELERYGLTDLSPDSFIGFLVKLGLDHHFDERTKKDRISLRKSILRENSKHHPAIRAYLQYVSAKRIMDCWVRKLPLGLDGRVHPHYLQNAAVTGRTSVVRPAIINMDANLRPLIAAPMGKGLLEFDYKSFDLAVAAARFNERDLLVLYDTCKRPYKVIAERYFPDLSEDSAKRLVLGFLYGKTKKGVSKDFAVSEEEAQRLLNQLEAVFPNLTRGMKRYIGESIEQGYAEIVPGFTRKIPAAKRMSPSIKRSLGNTAVQGAAASIFKLATVKVHRHFEGSDTLIVLQCHDALLIEAPAGTVDLVMEVVPRLMREAGQYFFSELNLHTECKHGFQKYWGKVEAFDSLLSEKSGEA